MSVEKEPCDCCKDDYLEFVIENDHVIASISHDNKDNGVTEHFLEVGSCEMFENFGCRIPIKFCPMCGREF